MEFNKLVKYIEDDIAYLEDLGLESGEILESIIRDYDYDKDKKAIIKAFKNCGYTIKE